ncbi:hypothetical protein C3L33_19161, partial [Rhododendron williamsianum]
MAEALVGGAVLSATLQVRAPISTSTDSFDSEIESKLVEMIDMSFFQRSNAKPSRFVMHDLLHDLAESVVGDFYYRLKDGKPHSISEKVRHFSYVQGQFDGFEKFKIGELPHSIGNLIHLRFLDLSNTLVNHLPESVCTLYLSGTNLKEMPMQMSRLKDLQQLTAFVVGKCSGSGINELKELHRLHGTISISGFANEFASELLTLTNLKELKVERCPRLLSFSELVLQLPKEMSNCYASLERLTLDGCESLISLPLEAYDYVKAVDEAQKLTETLESLCLDRDGEECELLRRAHDVVHMAMVRLEEEFRHMLVQKRQLFEREDVSFRSSKGDVENEWSVMSFGDESFESFRSSIEDAENKGSVSSFWDSLSGSSSEDSVIHLVHPSVIPDLKCIAKLMFASSYDRECTQAFISVQKDALDDCLFMLEVEKLSIEDVLKMEWGALNSQIRRWIWAMKIFVRVHLACEKRLSDQIFGGVDLHSSICFIEASQSSMLQLLNFAKAIAGGPHQPEKLLRILDMYEVLANLIPDIDALYPYETDSHVRNECQDVLRQLGYCVKATFVEFENLVASNTSTTPFPGGGIHPLTRYIMNYINFLTEYGETLNLILKDSGKENTVSFSPDLNPTEEDNSSGRSSFCVSPTVSFSPDLDSTEEDNSSARSSFCVSPTALHFRSLISILLCNLDDKSKLYEEDSLRHLFLMNNIHYMTQKVKHSELRTILGDEWIREHVRKFQQQAMNYERATWSSILSLLMDEGIRSSNSVSRTLLKERMQGFYVAFEEVAGVDHV